MTTIHPTALSDRLGLYHEAQQRATRQAHEARLALGRIAIDDDPAASARHAYESSTVEEWAALAAAARRITHSDASAVQAAAKAVLALD